MGIKYLRALLDTRKYIALSALFRRALFLLARSVRSKSRVGPFVDRSEIMRKALGKVSFQWHFKQMSDDIRCSKVVTCALGEFQKRF